MSAITPAQYKHADITCTIQTLLLFDTSMKSFKKTNKTKLMLCKPIFIVHGRVKGFLNVILQYKYAVPQLQKWVWHLHN